MPELDEVLVALVVGIGPVFPESEPVSSLLQAAIGRAVMSRSERLSDERRGKLLGSISMGL
ncbi:MAG TPA: hypothetical protein ENJ18_06650 [Nannocystis exedens]|nr:hypothetical protein [Nannocystis exedens]